MDAVSGRVNELAERRQEADRELSGARRALKRATIERQTAENKVRLSLAFFSPPDGSDLVWSAGLAVRGASVCVKVPSL